MCWRATRKGPSRLANAFVNDDSFDVVHERARGSLRCSERGPPHHAGRHTPSRRYDTVSLAAFTGRALMIFRAGFALNIVGSFCERIDAFSRLCGGLLDESMTYFVVE